MSSTDLKNINELRVKVIEFLETKMAIVELDESKNILFNLNRLSVDQKEYIGLNLLSYVQMECNTMKL